MKNAHILNPSLIRAIAAIGHTQTFVIADAGLPIPPGVEVIDLSLVAGVPGFLQTLRAVCSELVVESAVAAREMEQCSSGLYRELRHELGNIPLTLVDHEELKSRLPQAFVVVRTGETTSFANVILTAGVNF